MRKINIVLMGDVAYREEFDGTLKDAEKYAQEIAELGYLGSGAILGHPFALYYPPHRIKRIEIEKNETD